MDTSNFVGPVGLFIRESGLSTVQVARIVGLKQPTVWRHATGKARISADAMEAYNARLKISMKDLRDWNRSMKNSSGGPPDG